MKYVYHFSYVIPNSTGYSVSSGSLRLDKKIMSNQQYDDVIKMIAEVSGHSFGDFVVTSLTLLNP